MDSPEWADAGAPARGNGAERVVDVHAHYVPRSYRRALVEAGIDKPDGFPYVPNWTAETAIASMDALGIDLALISVSSPGVNLGPPIDPVTLARTVNDEGADIIRSAAGRLGLLASLPLPDIDASLEEIARGHDDLGVVGFVLMTNYRGVYLGDSRLDPVMDELDRRGALVALHPTSPPGADAVALGRPRPILEFPFDTARAVVNMILNGTVSRRPRLRVVVPHVGSGLPVLADRVQGLTSALSDGAPPVDVHAQLRRMWFDVAGEPLPGALPALLRLVGPDRVLYGSDMPFTPTAAIERNAHALHTTDVLDDPGRRALFAGNAAAMLTKRDRPYPHRTSHSKDGP